MGVLGTLGDTGVLGPINMGDVGASGDEGVLR